MAERELNEVKKESSKNKREINQLKEEQENAGTVRLGALDGYNEVQRNGSIAEQRKRSGGNIEATARNRPPFKQAGEPEQGHRPIGNHTGATNHPQPSPARPRPGRQSGFPPFARLGLPRRLRSRRSFRRIYRELIMLRDTLKARLLPNEGQRRSHPKAPEPEQQLSHPPKTTKPRQGGAERGA